MKVLRNFSRIFVGIVFIFSGFVKGVDPLGTTYRIEDYFMAYGWEWAMPLALFLSVSFCALEFLLGVALLLNLRIKYLSWILLPLMLWFTGLTLYDALYEPVPDCGCFGDAVTLSNWQTFYKNVVLIIFVLIIFITASRFRSSFSGIFQNVLIIFVIVAFTGFSIYQYHHLPCLDFRAWKVGSDLTPENTGQSKVYLTFQNKSTGEKKEYLSPDYPWQDSIWLAQWEFVDQRIDDSEVIKGHDLVINDLEGNDVTSIYIANTDYQFFLISYSLAEADKDALMEANDLYKQIDNAGYSFIAITGSLGEEIEKVKKVLDTTMEFFNADDIDLKTMIRANPGIILIKDGIVINKWHYNDFPVFQDLNSRYFNSDMADNSEN